MGGLHENFSEINFLVGELLETIDIYQMLSVLWKNIVPNFLAEVIDGQRSAPVCNYILRTIFNQLP